MKEKGLHEGTIEQIQRLFADHLANGGEAKVDDRGRIRIDDWEMGAEVQKAVADFRLFGLQERISPTLWIWTGRR